MNPTCEDKFFKKKSQKQLREKTNTYKVKPDRKQISKTIYGEQK